MQPHSAPHRRPARGAFTIVELLVVITIIAILLSLTVRVMGAFITAARESATQTTIRKIQSLLNSRAEAIQRLQKRPKYIENSPEYYDTDCQLLKDNPNLRKIVAKKRMSMKYFPQSMTDVKDFQLYPQLENNSLSNPELLYHFLTQSAVLSDAVGLDAFSTSEVGDPDGNGFPEFLDAWGRSLFFYRWPTRLFRNNEYWASSSTPTVVDPAYATRLLSALPTFSGNLATDFGRDPDDPLRLCTTFNRFKPASQAPYNTDFEAFGDDYHTPGTYHVMLVISSGADGQLGLYPPTDASATHGNLGAPRMASAERDFIYDDITYLNTRVGGR